MSDRDFQSPASCCRDLSHTQNHQDLIWNVRTDTTDRITFPINVKKTFLFGHVFKSFLNVFFIFQKFFIAKNVGKAQNGKQINKKHF